MKEQKGFITQLGELIDERHAQQRNKSSNERQPGRFRRFLRWLTPNGGTLLLIAILILTRQVWAEPLLGTTNVPGPSATTVNYQGRLADNAGTPLDGTYGMEFALYDAPTGGNLVWGPESHSAVPVSDGLFSVGLGSQTSGGIPTSVWDGDIYLEVTVGGETLEPRELIRSVPIAGMALTVPDGAITFESLASSAIPVFSASTTENYWSIPQCDGNWYTVPGLSMELDPDQASTLVVNFSGLGHNSNASENVYTAVFIDGSVTRAASGAIVLGGCRNSSTDSSYQPWCTLANNMTYSLDSGQHTLEIRAQCDNGSAEVYSGWLNAILFP